MKKLFLVLLLCTRLAAQAADWGSVETIFGRKGTVKGQVFKVAFPRSDLKVTVGPVAVDPALALTSWIALKRGESHTILMGDLVLLGSEVSGVTAKLISSNIEVTAIHNHIIGESPRIMYVHVSGQGEETQLAEAAMSVLKLTGTPTSPPPLMQMADTTDWKSVESTFGFTGQRKGNVLQFAIPRSETIIEHGNEIPSFMGMATAINIQRVGAKAAATGDFVLLADEVKPVMTALTQNGIVVTALHNHMLFESPRLFFMHFWGIDKPERIAGALRKALEKTNHQKSG